MQLLFFLTKVDQAQHNKHLLKQLISGENQFLQNLSIDQVVFGYENRTLFVLLLEVDPGKWMLPGGYIFKDESVEGAAKRILTERTGLSKGYLRQFHVFGDAERSFSHEIGMLFQHLGIDLPADAWILKRFVSVGYYALINKRNASPKPLLLAKGWAWHPVQELPELLLDHGVIVGAALEGLREQLHAAPIAYHLLGETFTMPELHAVYETIHQKMTDRSRFQKKMFEFDFFERLGRKEGVPHKRPFLYRARIG